MQGELVGMETCTAKGMERAQQH